MAEMRLIDANAEAEWAMENLPEPHSGVVIQFLRDSGTIDPETLPIVRELRDKLAEWEYWMGYRRKAEAKSACEDRAAVKTMRKHCEKTIAVLREELDKVTAELDVAVDRIKHYAGCWECDMRDKGKCAMPFYKNECDQWEWRGPQKEADNE